MLDPALRGKPVGIKQKYLLVTCNYTARRLGVRKMEGVIDAKRRCPSLIVMDGEDLTRYREASEAIFRFENRGAVIPSINVKNIRLFGR